MLDFIKSASDQIRTMIMEAVEKLVSEGIIPSGDLPDFAIEIPANKSHGDFAANTAMVYARSFKIPSRNIAKLITEKINLTDSIFERIEIASAGFMNFFLRHKWFVDIVKNVLIEGENYGRTNLGKGKSVLIEFVSANPTGPMHIGNARGGAIGDCLASIFDWTGYNVQREFYVNDAGNQIEKFGKSLDLRFMQFCSDRGTSAIDKYPNRKELFQYIYNLSGEGMDFEMPKDVYLGIDIIEHAYNYLLKKGPSLSYDSETARRKTLVDYALPINIACIERDLKKYRIIYDNWFRESTLHKKNKTKTVVDKLLEIGKAYDKDGTIWFKSTEYGLDKDFVLRRKNGFYTYIVSDIAYHYDKLVTRKFDKAINIFGADHHGYVHRLKAALTALGVDTNKLDILLVQMVRLVRDGKIIKISKRSGNIITLVTLLDEIPIDAVRFYFNLREADSQFEFDLDLAIEKSIHNPVFYVQYAHARICSLLTNLKNEGISIPEKADFTLLNKTQEIDLIRHIALFPHEIQLAAKQYNPAKLTRYAVALATLFHRFYDICHVKNTEYKEIMNARILFCIAIRQILRNIMNILKIEQPEKM